MSAKKNSLKTDSSLKFFTLILEELNEDGLLEATKVPAKKGKSLFDAVQAVLENYGMSCESHSLFLGSSNTPLPLHDNDAFFYREQTLYVRENEKFRNFVSFKRNDSKKATSIATKRFTQLLDGFELSTIVTDQVDGLKEVQSNTNVFALEASWKEVITEQEEMAGRCKDQQEGVWELFTSEISYIKDLKVITDVFMRCFKMLQYAGYLTEVDETLIFANIEDVYDVNVEFWERLKLVVEKARVTREPISPSQLVSSFEGFENLFQPYIEFCNADTPNMKLPDFPPSTNEMIKKFIEWCNNHKECKRLTIAGFLIKPLQRVTKYSLLIKAIMNKTDDETERCIAEEIMSRVETFVSKINSAVHLRQEIEKMDSVIIRLSDYCPIEAFTDESDKIIKQYCKFDLRENIPGLEEARFILKEGQMKLVEKQGKRDVYVFLFSDIILITKLKRNIDKYRIIRQPYCLDKIVLHNLKDSGQLLFLYLNEYEVVANAFVLQANIDEQDRWKTAIEKAKSDYESIRSEISICDEFPEDVLPSPSVSINKSLRKRGSSIMLSALAIAEPDPSDLQEIKPPVHTYEWDGGLTVVVMIMFVVLNIFISRLTG